MMASFSSSNGSETRRLNATLELEQLEVHVDCVGKLRLACAQRAKLDDLTRFGAWRAGRRLPFGHGADHDTSEAHPQEAPAPGWLKPRASRPMKILMVASEALPFAKTGGLADVLGALPGGAGSTWDTTSTSSPAVSRREPGESPLRFPVTLWPARQRCHPVARSPRWRPLRPRRSSGLFRPRHLYGTDGHDYPDNPERFAFLCQAALEWAWRSETPYQVVHAHDWQAGLVPLLAARSRWRTRYAPLPTVMTIHNLAYQGVFDASWLPRLGLGLGADAPRRAGVSGVASAFSRPASCSAG